MDVEVKRFWIMMTLVTGFGVVVDYLFRILDRLTLVELVSSYVSVLGSVIAAYWLAFWVVPRRKHTERGSP